jgi:diacylglycerol kinase family enzyme
MFQSGTGNDFIRSLNTKEDFPHIQSHLQKLPTVTIDGKSHKFVNGIDIGLGGHVGHIIESRGRKKSKFEFFRSTLVAIKEFKPFELSLKTKDIDMTEKKIWFVAIMHGAYFGGGMQIAPKQTRDQKTLSLIVAKDCPKWLLFVIFTSIYICKQFWFKKYIDYYQVSSAKITTRSPQIAEFDGEVQRNVSKMEIVR